MHKKTFISEGFKVYFEMEAFFQLLLNSQLYLPSIDTNVVGIFSFTYFSTISFRRLLSASCLILS